MADRASASGHLRFLALLSLALTTACDGGEASDQTIEAPERIIVSGASGQLGGATVDHLLELGVAPENLILVSRSPEALEQYAAMGASTRFGDFTQPESLATAYEGGTRMLLISINTGFTPGPDGVSERQRLHQTAIDGAVAAGVDHIVYTSFTRADTNPSPIAADHRATEQMLRDSGLNWTMLRNGLYMDGLVGRAADMLEAGEVLVSESEEGTAYIARDDCAAAAAAVLAGEGHENRIYELTGSEAVGAAELARAAAATAGQPIEIRRVPDGTEGVVSLDTAGGEAVSGDFRELTGRDPITVGDMLEQNREVLQREV